MLLAPTTNGGRASARFAAALVCDILPGGGPDTRDMNVRRPAAGCDAVSLRLGVAERARQRNRIYR